MSNVLIDDIPLDIVYEISIYLSLKELDILFDIFQLIDDKNPTRSVSFWIFYLNNTIIDRDDKYDIRLYLANHLALNYRKYNTTNMNQNVISSNIFLIQDLENRLLWIPHIISLIESMINDVKIRSDLKPIMPMSLKFDPDASIYFLDSMIEIKYNILDTVGWEPLDPLYYNCDKWKNAPINLEYKTIKRAMCEYLIPGNRHWAICLFDNM